MQSGDLVLCTSTGIVGRAIRWVQRREGYDHQFSRYNHVAVLREPTPDGSDWYIYQAEASGVTADKLLSSVAPGGHTSVRNLPVGTDRQKFLEALESKISAPYGFLVDASCALDLILPQKVCLRRSGTFICSGLVAYALLYAGWPPAMDLTDIYETLPADLAQAIA